MGVNRRLKSIMSYIGVHIVTYFSFFIETNCSVKVRGLWLPVTHDGAWSDYLIIRASSSTLEFLIHRCAQNLGRRNSSRWDTQRLVKRKNNVECFIYRKSILPHLKSGLFLNLSSTCFPLTVHNTLYSRFYLFQNASKH